jgi:hypothetical protein
MAQKITVTLEDDLDGGPADQTVRFGLDGAEYEIDLSISNATGDVGVCDNDAVITRRFAAGLGGEVDVPLCAPCAVAQGVAEMPR